MVDPQGAVKNCARLAGLGASGRYSFYEALDFTRPACRKASRSRWSWLHGSSPGHDDRRHREHASGGPHAGALPAEPMIQAVELLLQERTPHVAVARPRAEEVRIAATDPARRCRRCAA